MSISPHLHELDIIPIPIRLGEREDCERGCKCSCHVHPGSLNHEDFIWGGEGLAWVYSALAPDLSSKGYAIWHHGMSYTVSIIMWSKTQWNNQDEQIFNGLFWISTEDFTLTHWTPLYLLWFLICTIKSGNHKRLRLHVLLLLQLQHEYRKYSISGDTGRQGDWWIHLADGLTRHPGWDIVKSNGHNCCPHTTNQNSGCNN